MKKFALILPFLIAANASAQSITPQSPQSARTPLPLSRNIQPSASTPAAATSPAQNAEKMQLAMQLNQSFAKSVDFEKTMQAVADQYIAELKKAHPQESQAKLDAVRNNMVAISGKYKNSIMQENAQVFSDSFTVDDLRQIIAFNNSPVGQKIGSKSGAIARNAISGQEAAKDGANKAMTQLSMDDINQIKAFYTSPVGQKMQNNMEVISGKLKTITDKYMQLISNDVDKMTYETLGYTAPAK